MNKLLELLANLFKRSIPVEAIEDVVEKDSYIEPKERLGYISKIFESGKSGPGTISSGKGDPGGKSYGCHQLASKTNTLQAYLKRSIFASEFEGLIITSPAFDRKWKEIANKYPLQFEEDQWKFIKKTHYDGVRGYARALGIPDTRAINEALFSMGVQHGRAKDVIDRAGITKGDSEIDIINKLYDARERYVRGLKMAGSTKQGVINRYAKERKMVLRIAR